MDCHDLPHYSKLWKWIQELIKERDIAPCPANVGVQQSLKLRFMVRVCGLISSKWIDPSTDIVIAVNLNGDKTNLGWNIPAVNFAFTTRSCYTSVAFGNHTIAILKCAESYDDLFTGLSDFWEEVSHITVLDVNGCTFTIIFFWGRLDVFGYSMWHWSCQCTLFMYLVQVSFK